MKEVVKVEVNKSGLTSKEEVAITNSFAILEEEKKVLVSEYNDIIKKELTTELSNDAAVLDKKLQKHLKEKENIHKAKKAFFLNGGRFVDSIFNVDKVEFGIMRSGTQKIKNFAAELEKKRLDQLQIDRAEILSEFVEDASERDLIKFEEDEFQALVTAKKKEYLDKIQLELDAEKERQQKIKAEKEEQERIKKENESLRKEAEVLAKAESERKEKEEVERKEREDKERKERESYEAKIKAEIDEKERIKKEERVKRENLEAELKEKEDAIIKAVKDEEERVQSELNKGDSDKVKDLIKDLESLKNKYTFKAAKTKKMYKDVGLLIDKVTKHISN